MRLRPRDAIPWLTVFPSLAFTLPARAESSRATVVWYRASEECPSGLEFLSKLPEHGSHARLADAGDHIDFLVTLIAARGETIGRLERQTRSGTVAIRELGDPNCGHVADALALSLALALSPSTESQSAGAPTPDAAPLPSADPTPAPVAPNPEPAAPSAPPPLTNAQAPIPVARPAPEIVPVAVAHAAPTPRWSAGLEGGVLVGIAPSPIPRAAAFVDLAGAFQTWAPDLALRFGVVGALGSTSTEVGAVKRWLLAGHAEVCPWRWGGSRFGLSPCAALEVGGTGASDTRRTGLTDAALWVAPSAELRGALRLAGPLSLEAQGGALVPLVRNEIYAGSQVLYRADVVAFEATLGLSLRVP